MSDDVAFSGDATPLTAIPVYPGDESSSASPLPLDKLQAQELALFVNDAKDPSHPLYVHQSLMTGLIAQKEGAPREIDIHIMTWEKVKGLLHIHATDNFRGDIIVLLSNTGLPKKNYIRAQYAAICDFASRSSSPVRTYPCHVEAECDNGKGEDIRALDSIAQAAFRNGHDAYAFRPVTCWGVTSTESCPLADHGRSVAKRPWSGFSRHVNVIDRKEGATRCVSEGFFHQQYIPELFDGEYRVFIVTEPDSAGTRGLRGRVMLVSYTVMRRTGPDVEYLAEVPESTRFAQSGTSYEKVCAFSLFVFEELRMRYGSEGMFKSLDTGVRLDIGVHRRFLFVNEITRWYGATYFSQQLLGGNCRRICEEFARAFLRDIARK